MNLSRITMVTPTLNAVPNVTEVIFMCFVFCCTIVFLMVTNNFVDRDCPSGRPACIYGVCKNPCDGACGKKKKRLK